MWGPQGKKYIVYAGKHLSLPHKPESAQHKVFKDTALIPTANTESAFCIHKYYKYVTSKNTWTHLVFRTIP